MFYFIKTPVWLVKLYRNRVWQMPDTEKNIYLTFDDGPHPEATPFVLDELKKFGAKATFFCIGKNVLQEKEIYARIIREGHAVGNHTFDHLNGWKSNNDIYMNNIGEANKCIRSLLFRPPYGRITQLQLKLLSAKFSLSTIMWTVLSGDFDMGISSHTCLQNVLNNSGKGSIVVFHDSEKAYQKIKVVLPKVLEYFTQKGYCFKKIELN